MTSLERNPFDEIDLDPIEVKQAYDRNPSKNPFEELEIQESWGKNLLRTLYQVPSGLAKGITYPLDLLHMIGVSDASDPEEIERLKMISEREGIPFDEEKYYDALEQASESFPTQGNIERYIEKKTGAPLTAKTGLQKFINFASTATSFSPKGYTVRGSNIGLPKPVLGTAVASTKEGLTRGLGIPEPISELASFAILKKPPEGSPSLSIGKETKPSGLPTRRYESINKPTEVSSKRISKIDEKVEQDVRSIVDDLRKDSPIENTYNSIKEDASFKSKIGEKFEEVEKLAEKIPDKFSSNEIKKDISSTYVAKESKGITPSEYEKDYRKFMKEFVKETPSKDMSASQLISQYRKNNKSLSDLYEPAKSKAYNRAKKDSILDYNKIIAKTIEKKYPNSEFSELFNFTNKRWTEIKDVEFLDKYLDDLVSGKVNFEKGRKFFNKEYQEPFKRAFGENYPQFEQLMKDLMSTEQARSLIKTADKQGFNEFGKLAMHYLVHPKLAAGKVGFEILKDSLKSLLDKPRLALVWDQGIKAAKKGNFKQAEASFSLIDKELSPKESSVKKYNEYVSKKKNQKQS